MDGIRPEVRKSEAFQCPKVAPGGYGYAFDSRLDRAKADALDLPAETTMLYDSVNPARNASDPFTSLPAMPRYWPRNNMAYADGHATMAR